MKIRFGEFELDSRRYRLRRGGETVALRPKVFDLLIYLARHRERVVPREELVRVCWGETRVGEGSLSGLVNELRGALGEGARGPSSIRTVHARGYQFVAPVVPEEARTGPDETRHEDRGGTAEALRRIRLELERMLREGPRGVVFLVEGAPASRPLLEQMRALAGHLGIESLELGRAGSWPDAPRTLGRAELATRLRDLVVERCGLSLLRERARSDLDRLLRPRPREACSDAVDWDRALRRLLRQAARERPLLLLFEGLESFDPDALELVESLLGIDLESAPLLVVCSLPGSVLAAASAPGEALFPRLERLLFGSGFGLFRHLDPERARLDAWCRERGVEPLPEPLAVALLAHLAGHGVPADAGASGVAMPDAERAEATDARRALDGDPHEPHPGSSWAGLPERPRMRWARAGSLEAPRRVNEGGG